MPRDAHRLPSGQEDEEKRIEGADRAVVSLEGVTYRYHDLPGAPPVLEDVALSIKAGDFLGVIGPNGGGKTTLLKIMLGLLRPQAGVVRVLGRPPREVSRLIGYVPQHVQIDENVPATVQDVVLTGRLGLSSWGVGYGPKHTEAALAAMERAGVAELKDRSMGTLSGGQRQRVLIARSLAGSAKILLLDEPMAGVDTHMEKGILDLLHTLNAQIPVVLVSHDIGFVSAHVNRVACLNRRLVVHRPEEISEAVIAEMYRTHGTVQRIRHSDECPIDEEEK